jgi:hypothetical protein
MTPHLPFTVVKAWVKLQVRSCYLYLDRSVYRLKIFAKGNVDVHDSLHSCRVGGRLLWNGINSVFREIGWTCRLQHETWARSDALSRATGRVPVALARRDLPLGSYVLQSQFSRKVFETDADAIVLSVQPDISSSMRRHKTQGYFFYPSEITAWPEEDRRWLNAEFDHLGPLSVDESMRCFRLIVDAIRAQSTAPILIYNMSPVVPGEAIHCYLGVDDSYATRIRRFNIGLTELSQDTGVSIVDVDSLLARHGADRLKLDALHLTAQGYELIAREVVRVLIDVGTLDRQQAGMLA